MRNDVRYEIKRVTEAELDRHKDALVRVCIESFGDTMREEEVLQHLRGDAMFVAYRDGEPVGFASMDYRSRAGHLDSGIDVPEVYLSAAFVGKHDRHLGLYKDLVKARIAHALREVGGLSSGEGRMPEKLREFSCIISTRTQNPTVEERIVAVLKELEAESHLCLSEVSRELVKGAFGRMLTDEVPSSKNSEIDAVYKKLDYGRGDAFILRISVHRDEMERQTYYEEGCCGLPVALHYYTPSAKPPEGWR